MINEAIIKYKNKIEFHRNQIEWYNRGKPMINEAIIKYKNKIEFHRNRIEWYNIRIEYLEDKKKKLLEYGQTRLGI